MRALIGSIVWLSVMLHRTSAAALGYVSIDLVIEPEHLPKFACVLTADPVACPSDSRCTVAIKDVRDPASSTSEIANIANKSSLASDVPPSTASTHQPPMQPALVEALRALSRSDQTPRCQSEAACPSSILTPVSAQYLTCAERSGPGSLVAVLDLTGIVTQIVSLKFQESHLGISTSRENGSVWVTSAGGHFAPGLSQRAVGDPNNLRATLVLATRCQERTIQLPVADRNVERPRLLEIKENTKLLLKCDPRDLDGNELIVQIPMGREGIARSLSLQPSDSSWEAATTWSSRAPPDTLKLWWKQLSFDIHPDCVLPAPIAVQRLDPCPDVRLSGAQNCESSFLQGTCHYQCTAVSGGAVITPSPLILSYGGMEWSDVLPNAFSTISARPPQDIRRLYFSRLDFDEIDAIEVHGPRGFRQRIEREFQTSQPYQWLSMPGLQCNDVVSYIYHGRFEHRELSLQLTNYPVLRLVQPEDSWGYPISVYLGAGAAVTELRRPAPYIALGVDLGGPLSVRSEGGMRPMWYLGMEYQLTYRLYDALNASSMPLQNEKNSVLLYRILWWAGLGYSGFRSSPSLWRTILPSGIALRVGAGWNAPSHLGDRGIAGGADFITVAQFVLYRRFSSMVSGGATLGVLAGEDVRDDRIRAFGAMPVTETGWHGLRFVYGFHLSITP